MKMSENVVCGRLKWNLVSSYKYNLKLKSEIKCKGLGLTVIVDGFLFLRFLIFFC